MAKRKLVSQRNMDKLEREINQTCINTGMYHTKLSIELGKSAYYLNTAIKQGCSVEKEREIIKQLKDFTKQHYISIHRGRNGTHIHVKDNSVESNKIKKENDELKKQILCLQDNHKRVNTANETTIHNLHNKVEELMKKLGDLEVEKLRSNQWKEDNKLLTESIRQKQERIEQQEMELVGLKGWNFEPRKKIILDKKLFSFNVVISKGEK